jgi:hypothetical protein
MQPLQRAARNTIRVAVSVVLLIAVRSASAEAALLLEQPYGAFGILNPTGHAAIYLDRVCADTPVHLRECSPGEGGVVISRYTGIAGYDWVAIPPMPYFYALDDPAQVPERVDEHAVAQLRSRYRELKLNVFAENLPPGSFLSDGWTQLVGTAYDRRTYAFRFATTHEQDRAVIVRLNAHPNHSHFNIFYNNCADFDRVLLKTYFPSEFRRSVFPDAGITTPKQITHALVKYARQHPEMQLTVFAIPQIPGYRRHSREVHGVAESLFANGYVIPIVVLNPYLAGGLLADYLLRGRYHLVPKDPTMLDPTHLDALGGSEPAGLTPSLTLIGPPLENPATTFVTVETSLTGQGPIPAEAMQYTVHH